MSLGSSSPPPPLPLSPWAWASRAFRSGASNTLQALINTGGLDLDATVEWHYRDSVYSSTMLHLMSIFGGDWRSQTLWSVVENPIAVLLRAGADPNIRDASGATALQLAIAANNGGAVVCHARRVENNEVTPSTPRAQLPQGNGPLAGQARSPVL